MKQYRKISMCLCMAALGIQLIVPAAAFSDTSGHWAEGAIRRWSESGVLVGYGDGTFGPDRAVTRGELAAVLSRILGWQEQAENTFSDLPGDAWYTPYLLQANQAGVMDGDGTGMRPQDPVTRQETAVILVKAMCLEEQEHSLRFSDADQVAEWARGAVETLTAMGYLAGMDDGTLRPEAAVTRGQLSVILDQMAAEVYSRAGFYSQNVEGTLVVAASGVTLRDMVIDGDLILTQGAAGSETTLYNVQVTGRIVVQGEALQQINLTGSTEAARLWAAGERVLLSAGSGITLGGVTLDTPGARVAGVPAGTEITVTDEAGQGYVNGYACRAGEAGKAQAGSDVTIGIEIGVNPQPGGSSGTGWDAGDSPEPSEPAEDVLDQPQVLSRGADSVTISVQKGVDYLLTAADGTPVSRFPAQEDGTYTFAELSMGHYYIQAERQGFQSPEPLSIYVTDGGVLIDWSEAAGRSGASG